MLNRLFSNCKVFLRNLKYRSLYTAKSLEKFPRFTLVAIPESLLYYNGFGRFLFWFRQRLYLALGWREKLAIRLEHFDSIDYSHLYEKGSTRAFWPVGPYVERAKSSESLQNGLAHRLQDSYASAYSNDPYHLPQSAWWKEMTTEFKSHFFTGDQAIRKDVLADFRRAQTSRARIVSDQLDRIFPEKSFSFSYLKSLELILEYHRLSDSIDHAILGSVSESFSGNNLCPVYRGQRLSRRLLTHAYYFSQIRKHVDFKPEDTLTILDLGGAYGGLVRLLSLFYSSSRVILVELPEICVLAGYFLSQALPHKKVVTFSEIDIKALKAGRWNHVEGDVFILPTWAIEYLQDASIDLIINTTSLGEMSKDYGDFYMRHIERIARGYFYSNNRAYSDVPKYDDFGFYNWGFQKPWHPILYQMSPIAKLEWLGRIDRRETTHASRE